MLRKTLLVFLLGSAVSCLFPRAASCQGVPDGLSVVDTAAWQRLKASRSGIDFMMQLTFLAIRDQPSLLDDKACLRSFILYNNNETNYQKAVTLLRSEFDAPVIEKYYKEHAAEIVATTPTTIRVSSGSLVDTVNGHESEDSADVGTYDMNTHTFPWVDHFGNPAIGEIDNVTMGDAGRSDSGLVAFQLSFQGVKITQIKVDEEIARSFSLLGGNGEGNAGNGKTRRRVTLVMDLEIPPAPVKVTVLHQNTDSQGVTFNTKLVHMDVVGSGNKVLSTIYP